MASNFGGGDKRKADTDLRKFFPPVQKRVCDPPPSTPETSGVGCDDRVASVSPDVRPNNTGTSSTCPGKTAGHVAAVHGDVQNDVGLYVGQARPDDLTLVNILEHHWQPYPGYELPFSIHKKGNNDERRFLRLSHLAQFPWLVLSPSLRGLFCVFCAFFAKPSGGQGRTIQLGALVKEPLTKFAKLLGKDGDLPKHEISTYHHDAVLCAEEFLKKVKNPETNVVNQIDSYRLEQIKNNRAKLNLILQNVFFLGKQNIAFRGHRDDGPLFPEDPKRNDGNFRALLRFRVARGDTPLAEHLESPGINLTSKTVQNDLIECCGEEILDSVLSRVRQAKYYSCGFDETVDLAHVSQLSIFLRYVWHNGDKDEVREDFVGFIDARKAVISLTAADPKSPEDVESESNSPSGDDIMEDEHNLSSLADQPNEMMVEPTLTGIKLGQIVVRELQGFGLDLKSCVGIATDGCATNVSETIGAIQEVQKEAVHAVRCPCYNHRLNLTLSKTSKVQDVRNAFGIMAEVITFFTASSKRNIVLKAHLGGQLTGLCDTRWVEHHDAVLQFLSNLNKIAQALETISEWSDVQGDPSPPKARALLSSIMDGSFIVSICCLSEIMTLTSPLSRIFQTKNLDVHTAKEAILDAKAVLEEKRSKAEEVFSKVYAKATKVAEELGTEIKVPRVIQRQRNRSNAPSDCPEEYYRRNLYIPLLDWVVEDIDSRFSEDILDVYRLHMLLPHILVSQTSCSEDIDIISEKFAPLLGTMQDSFKTQLQAEVSLWNARWRRALEKQEKIPSDVISAYDACHPHLYPTVRVLIQILLTVPVGIATSERSFSTLRLSKSYIRATCGQNRLNGLALMYIHRDIPLNSEKVIDRYAVKKPRILEYVCS